jgi:prepilin-type N-terminal cleavage/methylation domain-containing protein/prepilin-type processing-associated H-X9-DG protein
MHHIAQRRSAFTLVELLVVVAIIALLIAMLLPALSKAKEAARTVLCLANQHQSGTALQMYAGEFEGVGVISGLRQPGWKGYSWISFLNGDQASTVYMPDNESARCPKMGGKGAFAMVCQQAKTASKSGDPTVEWAAWPIPPLIDPSFTGLWTIRFATLPRPSDYVMFMDSARQDGVGGDLRKLPPQHGGATLVHPGMFWTGGQTDGLWMAHPHQINGLFADGHSESCGEQRLKSLANYNGSVSTKVGISNWWDEEGLIYHLTY